jgi:hypothetical protein
MTTACRMGSLLCLLTFFLFFGLSLSRYLLILLLSSNLRLHTFLFLPERAVRLWYSFIETFILQTRYHWYIPNTIPNQATLRQVGIIIILMQSYTLPQMTLTQFAFVLVTLTVFVVYWMNSQRLGRNFPPGPKKLPLIGNLLSMPSTLEWETFAKWGQEYSP